jgi:hypothetical protein
MIQWSCQILQGNFGGRRLIGGHGKSGHGKSGFYCINTDIDNNTDIVIDTDTDLDINADIDINTDIDIDDIALP